MVALETEFSAQLHTPAALPGKVYTVTLKLETRWPAEWIWMRGWSEKSPPPDGNQIPIPSRSMLSSPTVSTPHPPKMCRLWDNVEKYGKANMSQISHASSGL